MKENFSISEERKKLGLNQEELAYSLGITREYLSMLERGAKPMSTKVLKKFSELVSNSIDATGATVNSGIIGHNGTYTQHTPQCYSSLQGEMQEMRKALEAIALDISVLKKLLTK